MRKNRMKIRQTMLWIAVIAIPLQSISASSCGCFTALSCNSVQDCCSGNTTCCCNSEGASCCDSSQSCQCGSQCHCCDQQREIPVVPFSESRIIPSDLMELAYSSLHLSAETQCTERAFPASHPLGIASSSLAVCIAFNCFRL